MRKIRDDLWETRADTPLPGLSTHAYLWTGGPAGNVLFYSTMTDADFDGFERLGGVAHHYLSHRDEAGPMLERIGARFGARLHAPATESADIGRHRAIDVPLRHHHFDANGIEVIPTPGHSPGSTSYLVLGHGGRYLFTGDTVFLTQAGRWTAGYLPGISDASGLHSSLRALADLRPDLVISSAFQGTHGAHPVRGGEWAAAVRHAAARLPAVG